jgi:hypothetical protein
MGEAEAVLHQRAKRMNLKPALWGLLRSNGENSLSTPDFRFVNYAYQSSTLDGPHLPQVRSGNDAPLAPELLKAISRIR